MSINIDSHMSPHVKLEVVNMSLCTGEDKHPSVLLTNLYLAQRSGSELHILELAEAFNTAGWDVTCYALVIAYPLKSAFIRRGITLVEFGEENLLEPQYDVFFAQHHIVSDYLWSSTTIDFGVVVASSLGPSNEHEKLPRFKEHIDIALFNSEETRSANAADIPEERAMLFPNAAQKTFFEAVRTRSRPRRPEHIAVISNHVPNEVRQLASLLAGSPRSIEFFGLEYCSVEINRELLSRYDVVVTIGRTV